MVINFSEGGMSEIGWLVDGNDDQEASREAAKFEITASPLSLYSLKHQKKPAFVLGYSAFNEKEIRQGVRRLAMALKR